MNDPLRVLFVGDANLGRAGFEIVQAYFPQAVCVRWRVGDMAGKHAARHTMRSRDWDIVLSSYNDLVFQRADLERMTGVRINVHPALPSLPGVGYDTWPLLEGHDSHGATLHHIATKTDTGDIIQVLERSLRRGTTYRELRLLNQVLNQRLLLWACETLSYCETVSEMKQSLAAAASQETRRWDESARVNLQTRERRLADTQANEPEHPVLVGREKPPNLEHNPLRVAIPVALRRIRTSLARSEPAPEPEPLFEESR